MEADIESAKRERHYKNGQTNHGLVPSPNGEPPEMTTALVTQPQYLPQERKRQEQTEVEVGLVAQLVKAPGGKLAGDQYPVTH